MRDLSRYPVTDEEIKSFLKRKMDEFSNDLIDHKVGIGSMDGVILEEIGKRLGFE